MSLSDGRAVQRRPECACKHLGHSALLGASFPIMSGWHSAVSREQTALSVGGVWMDPSHLPDGVGAGVLTAVHQARPRGPGHRILEWEGGDQGPLRKEES